jgi:hypothetical protein
MKNFLDKLERMAEQFVGAMDEQLQQPIADTISGAVLMNRTTPDIHDTEQSEPQSAPVTRPIRKPDTTENEVVCSPVLREAR